MLTLTGPGSSGPVAGVSTTWVPGETAATSAALSWKMTCLKSAASAGAAMPVPSGASRPKGSPPVPSTCCTVSVAAAWAATSGHPNVTRAAARHSTAAMLARFT